MALQDFVQQKLIHYGQAISDHDGDTEEHALGEVIFYAALRRALMGKPTRQDLGLLDAVNDTLQELGILNAQQTFFKE